ncbi:MAG: TonB-dependent receptor [Bacteroidales bacterium]
MKRLFLFCGLFFLPLFSFAQKYSYDVDTLAIPEILDSVVISANMVTSKTPVSYSSVNHQQIKSSEPGASVPLILKLQPSVISISEAGAVIGNTKISVRGSNASRINITLDGIPLNDAESQEVFWANIPSMGGFLQNIQIQRGVGTSVNGPAAFGASINMSSKGIANKAYAHTELGYGSFNTWTTGLGVGTGIMKNGMFADLKYAYNTTDGYIRNGKAHSNSLFASLGWIGEKDIIKFHYILGDQHTGICWEGITREQMKNDRTYNPAGEYVDDQGNTKYYDNETDNYTQHFFQLFYSHQFSENLYWINAFNFTKGDGYYENYKANKTYSKYKLDPQTIDGSEYLKSDFIVRKQMDNGFYYGTSTLKYITRNINAQAGISYSYYDGDHFGNVLWTKYNQNVQENYEWYRNNGLKKDYSMFARTEYYLNDLTLFADMQYRGINYDLKGPDKDQADLKYSTKYNFFNPKAGLAYSIDEQNHFYGSVAVGHKEPTRDDLKEAIKAGKGDDCKAEQLVDYELGYKFAAPKFALGLNLYYMNYKDQLVATGRLSESGYVIKENIPNSYRRGIEITAGWQCLRKLRVDGNLTLSQNKITDFTNYVDAFDANWNKLPQVKETYENTDLVMSPSVIGMAMVTYDAFRNFSVSVNGKYVGKQYYDNTSSDDRSIPEYFTLGATASFKIPLKKGVLLLSAYADNILNKKYFNNAWVYRAFIGENETYVGDGFEGLYPQAPISCMFKVSYEF